MNNIILDNVHYSIKNINIIRGISFSISDGQSIVVIGQSGCGKSTFLKLCAGIYYPTEGKIYHNNENLFTMKREKKNELMSKIGFVFQRGGLISNTNVFNNLALSLEYNTDMSKKEIEKKIIDELIFFGLEDLKYTMPDTLSPGQRKIILFIRGILTQSKMLFLDDPFSDLNSAQAKKIIKVIKKHLEYGGITVTITNDQFFCDEIATHVAVIESGKLIEYDTIEKVKSTKNQEVKSIFNNIGIFQGLPEELLALLEEDIF